MKILLHSAAPWAQTGYGAQTAQLSTRLRDDGHDVAISATWGLNGNSLIWEGMPVYPADDTWGNLRLIDYANLHKADLVITLLDVWVLKHPGFKSLPLNCWTPVDHKPCPPLVSGFFKSTGARPIAMSKFGEQELKDVGLDPVYVPHAIDTNIFTPQDRDEARKKFGIPKDAFLVGMVANNAGHTPPRKAFPQAMLAFAELRRRHDDAFLYLHSELTGKRSPANPGVDLFDLTQRYQIPKDAWGFCDPVAMDVGFISPPVMAEIYSMFDVLLNPSYGEGFGIPIVEAQACGTPVITTDWTSMPELTGSGWLVGGEPLDDPDHRAFFMAPGVDMIVEALEESYEKRGDETLASEAVKFAAQYDADLVYDTHWKPALEKLSKPREVAPLPSLNREQRRRMAKKVAA